jgi:hypothetical protein
MKKLILILALAVSVPAIQADDMDPVSASIIFGTACAGGSLVGAGIIMGIDAYNDNSQTFTGDQSFDLGNTFTGDQGFARNADQN